MSITVNGQSCVPPGFRFHPTEEELLNYYLRKKVASEKIDLDVIRDVDLNKLEPWDILEKCRIGTTPQSDWYFFSHKDKKYPTGTRTNRATAAGFWKATGRDKVIYTSSKRIGMRKTLVFYKGRAPHGQKSDWIMHEYRLDEHSDSSSLSNGYLCSIGDATQEDIGWVVCRVFKKKNLHKANAGPDTCDAKSRVLLNSSGGGGGDGALDQFLQYMGRSCKQEAEAMMNRINNSYQTSRHLCPAETVLGSGSFSSKFMKLPPLGSPPTLPSLTDVDAAENSCFGKSSYLQPAEGIHAVVNHAYHRPETGLGDWAALDRLLASHLNSQSEASKQLACLDVDNEFIFPTFQEYHNNGDGGSGSGSGDGDLWSLASSASDHVSHVSHDQSI